MKKLFILSCQRLHWEEASLVDARRQLSFFVMVLCYSRMLYVEFTLSQTLEHFLACHQHAFEYFGVVPLAVMIDNAKTAVLERPLLGAPVFNPRYLDFARHYGFEIKACGVRKPQEKGRVENAVGYVQKGFLRGLATDPYSALNPAVRHWLETVANLRIHGQTQQRRRANEQRLLMRFMTLSPCADATTPPRAASRPHASRSSANPAVAGNAVP